MKAYCDALYPLTLVGNLEEVGLSGGGSGRVKGNPVTDILPRADWQIPQPGHYGG
jgi:hypothetical protein